MEVKVRLPAPARLLTLGEQSMLNELRFRWDREYRVDFNGHAWTAVSRTDDDIMRADTAPLLRDQIIGHYASLAAGRIR